MGSTEGKQEEFDLFLSHATPDKGWVLTFAKRFEALGLRVFLDSQQIAVGDNFVLRLSALYGLLSPHLILKFGSSRLKICADNPGNHAGIGR